MTEMNRILEALCTIKDASLKWVTENGEFMLTDFDDMGEGKVTFDDNATKFLNKIIKAEKSINEAIKEYLDLED